MPNGTFTLDIVTPEKLALSAEAVSLTVPGVEGYLGVLAGHAALMTELRAGDVTARTAAGETVTLHVGGGFMDVSHDRVVILADSILENAPSA